MSNMYLYIKRRLIIVSAIVFIAISTFAQNADFSVNNVSQCQPGNSFVFTNLSTGGSATYSWSFGDGTSSTATNPVKTYTGAGNFSVQLKATIGGSDHYVSKTVSVNPVPQCSFSYLVATGTGTGYTFQSNSSIISGGMSYSWNFGDGSTATSSNPSHTYLSTGNYNVTLTVLSDQGCVCSTTQNVVVTVSSSPSGCPDSLYSFCVNKSHQCLTGNSFIFTNTSNAPAGTTFSWNFGDGTSSTDASPSKTYTNPGTYIITLTSTYNGASCYSTKTVVVDNTPVVTINGGNCVGNTLTANITGTNISNLNWVNGSGIVSTNIPTWSATGQVVAGGNGAGSSVYPVPIGVTVNQLVIPKGIYMDNNKDLYVIDNYTSRVVKWTPGYSSGTSKCYSIQVTGVGVDCKGNIYTVDDICNCVLKWAPGATSGVVVAGGNGAGSAANQLDNPKGNLFIDNAGNIYIDDYANHRIQKWAPGGTSGVTVAGGNGYGSALNQLYYPHGFFVDDAGNIYVSDSRNNRILRFPAGSTSSTYGTVVAGGNGVGMGLDQLYNPFAVFVDKAGNIYVDDYGITNKHRIQLWTPLATSGITILEVSGSYSDYANANVWVDVNNGDIYVSDDANSRVMKYSVSGITNTYIPPAKNTYSVVVTTFDGCMIRTSVNVDSLPSVKPITGIDTVCVGDSVGLFDSTDGGSWISTASSTATINNIGFLKAVSAGIDTIQYTIINGGCSATVSKAINIVTNCNVNVSTVYHFCINKEHQCLTGNSFIFSNNSDTITGTTYSWDFGDGTTSTVANPAKTYSKAGTFTVKLIASNNGVNYYTTQNVTVDPMPSINVTGGTCTGNVLTANATGAGIADIIWKQGTDVIKTVVPNWNSIGNIVAGGNGTETISNPNYYASGYYTNRTDYPMGVYVDQQKVLYVVDKGMSRVERWLPGDSMGYVVCTGEQNVGDGKDCKGNIYVTDDVNNLVKKWAPGATSGVTVAGGHGLGDSSNQLHDPRGNLIIDKDFNLYICDALNNRIQKWVPGADTGITVAGGNNAGNAANQLNTPLGIFIDDAGYLYVADSRNYRIQRFDPGSDKNSNGVTVAGGNGYGFSSNQLSDPLSVFVDKSGNIYVDDYNYGCPGCYANPHLIRMFTPGSAIGVTILKAAGSFPDFSVPITFFDVSNGDIYIAENTNNRVMKYTVAGTGLKDTVTTSVSGTYQAIATTFNGCTVTSGNIVISTPTVSPVVKGEDVVCMGSSVGFTDTVALGGTWGSSNPSIATINNTGTVTGVAAGVDTIKYTYNNGGCTSIITNILVVNPVPAINVSASGSCNSSLLTANVTGNSTSGIIWKQYGIPRDTVYALYDTNAVTVAGGTNGSANNQLSYNAGIFVDASNNLYIADKSNDRVQKFTPGSTIGITIAGGNGEGDSCNQLYYPGALFVDATGNLYVCDYNNHRVQKFAPGSPNGITVAGGHGYGKAANQVWFPTGVFVDASGSVYVSDAVNSRVQRWDIGVDSGIIVAGDKAGWGGSADNQLNNPQGIWVDNQSNIYIADVGNDRIQKWSKNAIRGITVAGVTGVGGVIDSAHLSSLKNVLVDATGTMYITDNNRILRWQEGANYGTLIAGTNSSTYYWGVPNKFNSPIGIAFGTNGDLYVSDQGNSRVLKFPVKSLLNTFIPTTSGKYTATATSFLGCSSTDSTIVIIGITSKPSFTINTAKQCLTGNSFIFTNTSTSCGTPTYLWSFGDGTTSTATNPAKSYTNAGSYKVILTLTSGGVNYYDSQMVVVNPSPVIALNNTGNICSGSDTIHLIGATNASKIIWYKNGVAIDTVNATLSDSAVTVATSNALNGTYVDGAGNVDVIDVYGSIGWRILKYAVGATDSSVIAGGNGDGSAQNQFIDAWGVFVDPFGNLYVSDYENNRVLKFPPGSTSATNGVTVAGGNNMGSGTNQLSMPYGVFVDLSGNMYVADAGNSRIMKYVPGSTTGVVVAGGNNMGSAANQLNNPFGVWVDNNGYLYVADGGNNRIQKFPPGSTESTNGITVAGGNNWGTALNQLNAPNNVFVDGNGNIYVSEGNSSRILMFPPNSSSATYGTLLVGKYGRGSAPNQLSSPWGVFVDNNGNLYVGDESNRRVQKFVHQINTSFVPSSAGDYTAVVTTVNGCTSTSNAINVGSASVNPSFIINTASQCLTGNNYTFTNITSVCGTATYLWNFGDGTTANTANATHSYSYANTYNVTLKVTVSGIDYYSSQTVVVGSAPIASFNSIAGTGSDNAYTFISSSTINSGYITSYLWYFGDGTTDNTSNPNHIYAANGAYNVKLVVTSNGGCKDSITKSVVVTFSGTGGGTPVPSFNINTSQQCFNVNSFVFTNTSTAPAGTTYLWNFGDGTTSTSANATHSYTSQGNYNVTLIATYNGIDHYYAQTVWVKPMPVSGFNFFANKQSIYGYTFLSTSTIASGNMTYSWNFGDGTTDSVSNPQHTFTSDGRKDITLVVTSDAGCKDSTTHYQIFCPTMNNKAFRIDAASSCLNGNFWGVISYYGNTAGYPMTYLWDYGDGTTSTLGNPPWHTYATAGNKTITLKVTMAYPGCPVITDSAWDTGIYVDSMPIASFNISGSPTTMCFDPSNSYTFNNTTSAPAGTTYLWDFGDTTNSNLTSPSHIYTHPGNQTWDTNTCKINIKLVATTNMGCKDSTMGQVRLYPVPIAYNFVINGIYGTRDFLLNSFRSGGSPSPEFNNYILNDTTECFAGYNWFGTAINGFMTFNNDYWKVNFDDGTSGTSAGGVPGGSVEAPYHIYTTPGVHNFTGNMVSSHGCLSNTLYGHVTITPNTDTLPHSVIGLHTEITTNVGVDPYGNNYNHYKVFFANMGSTACRPIVASYWRFSYLTGAPFYNHGYCDYGFSGLLPKTSDSIFYGFDADPSVTYQIRLITVNDQGWADTAYATVGATNAGYIPFRADIISNSSHIGIFPNPAVQETNIEASADKSTIAVLIVYNSIGQIVSTKRVSMLANLKQSININVSTWAEGIYYVMLKDEQGQIIGKSKFIKTIK